MRSEACAAGQPDDPAADNSADENGGAPPQSDGIAGASAAIQHVLRQAESVAATDSTVLLLGESGTGKELFASYIHACSRRHAREMVCVNCAAIPATLIESELFGREKGAYTDAISQQVGRFELANRSTIFLDEIGDLPLDVQVKLLRVLEERQIERLGSVKSIKVRHADHRRDASQPRTAHRRRLVPGGPVLSAQRVSAARTATARSGRRYPAAAVAVHRGVRRQVRQADRGSAGGEHGGAAALPVAGEHRELRNAVERAMILASGPRLTVAIPTPLSVGRRRSLRLVDVQRDHIEKCWRRRGGGCGARAAPRFDWDFGPQRSRPGWPGSASAGRRRPERKGHSSTRA